VIQNTISWLAPPLHSLHWKIFVLCLLAVFLPGLYMAWKVGEGIQRGHLRSTEQGMIELAAAMAARWPDLPPETMRLAGAQYQHVFGAKNAPDLRMVLVGPDGRVISDSHGLYAPGTDRSRETDVRKALTGAYGARWERDAAWRTVILFSTVPVIRAGRIEAAVTIIRSTEVVKESVLRQLRDLALPALLALALAAGVSFALSTYLTGLLKNLARRAGRIADGEPGVKLETWSKSEIGDLARALESMRAKLEGKNYVQEMALTLSHEIKTPLTAIQGAAEILEQTDDPPTRKKFAANILAETSRLTALVARFLTLAKIESRPAETGGRSDLVAVAADIAKTSAARFPDRTLDWAPDGAPVPVSVASDALRQMIEPVLENAFQFTPPGGRVTLRVFPVGFEVSDTGPGIPAASREKIFDRFFTTVNPLTGRRGTGLGLAIVKSLADRHGARISIGTEAGASIRVDFTENS